MVKIPNLDELRKMGSGLMDSVGLKKGVELASSDEAVKTLFQTLQATLSELVDIQSKQQRLQKQLEQQSVELIKLIEAKLQAGKGEENK